MNLIYCGDFEVMKGSRANDAVRIGKTVRLAMIEDSLCLVRGRAAAKWWIEDADSELHVRTTTRVLMAVSDPEGDDGFVIYLPDQDVVSGEQDFFDGYWLRPVNELGRFVVIHGEEDLKKRCIAQAHA